MTTIAVFGSGTIEPGTPEYRLAREVGTALGRAGYTVMTGGYLGTMEAASRGGSEADAHVIGVTYGSHSRILDPVNYWVKEEIRHKTHTERLMHLVTNADGYVVMPGGAGTQREFVKVAEQTVAGEIPARPVVFMGEFWREAVDELLAKHEMPVLNEHFTFAKDVPEALACIAQHIGSE